MDIVEEIQTTWRCRLRARTGYHVDYFISADTIGDALEIANIRASDKECNAGFRIAEIKEHTRRKVTRKE